jgi:serine phosphatase RsbU (regulator of sigma subunit)
MAPGDLIILYTDGSTESRDRQGHLLGIDGLERVIKEAGTPRRWAGHLMRLSEMHQVGKNEDDILIATIERK